MKPWLFPLGISLLTVVLGTTAEAQNYPWCAQYTTPYDDMSCSFVSFGRCVATVRGIGGFCFQNSAYVPPPAPHRGHKQRYQEHADYVLLVRNWNPVTSFNNTVVQQNIGRPLVASEAQVKAVRNKALRRSHY